MGKSVVYKTSQGEFTISGDAAIDAEDVLPLIPTAYDMDQKAIHYFINSPSHMIYHARTTLHSVERWMGMASFIGQWDWICYR